MKNKRFICNYVKSEVDLDPLAVQLMRCLKKVKATSQIQHNNELK